MKTRTQPLRARDYLSLAGTPNATVNLTRLIDDALAALAAIRATGYGLGNQKRSRGVIVRSFKEILTAAGYAELDALRVWREQVLCMEQLNITAEE